MPRTSSENAQAKALIHSADDDALHALLQSAAGTLGPQHREFARWLADKPHVGINEQLEKLKECTGYDWSNDERKVLLGTGPFRTYFLAVREKSLRSARIRIEEVAVKGIEALDWAIDKAIKEGDHRSIPNIVSPALERAMPRRQDLVNTAPTIIIQISGAQRAIMESVSPIVDAEILSIEAVEPD